jgi:hypothetical protein
MRRAVRRLRHRLWVLARRLEQRQLAGGEMQHAEDRAQLGEWGPLG